MTRTGREQHGAGHRWSTAALALGVSLAVVACAPPKPAAPYPAAPAAEGTAPPPEAPAAGQVVVDGASLDLAPIVRGWFPYGLVMARGDAALAWVDDDGAVWLVDLGSPDASKRETISLASARMVAGLVSPARSLRAIERDGASGRTWALVGRADGDAWVEVDGQGRETELVAAPAGIVDARRLDEGALHVWTEAPRGEVPARLRSRRTDAAGVADWASLPTGATFADVPLAADPGARVVWAVVREREGRPRIVQVSRVSTAGGTAEGVMDVPLDASEAGSGRSARKGQGTTSAAPREIVLAADTVDGALVFASWDGARSVVSTWSPGRARLVKVVERPGRIRQLQVVADGAVIAVVERPGEQVRERIDLVQRLATEAASLPANLELLGALGADSVWAYSSPQTPLTVVRTRWSDAGAAEAEAVNVPLLAPDAETLAAKSRCVATWEPPAKDDPDGSGRWQVAPREGERVRSSALRSDPRHGVPPWSVDLALACAVGARVTLVHEPSPATSAGHARADEVSWRGERVSDAAAFHVRVPLRAASPDAALAQAVSLVEFLLPLRDAAPSPPSTAPDGARPEDALDVREPQDAP